jgi:hypothetical protein
MEDITNRLVAQSTFMMNSQTQQFINSDMTEMDNNTTDEGEQSGSFGYIMRFLFMTSSVILSTLIAAGFSMLIPTLTRGSRNLSFNIKSFTDRIGLTTPLSEILLESVRVLSNYGPESITITLQKLAVLHYLKKHMKNYKDLFKIKEKDNSSYDYNEETNENVQNTSYFYDINQSSSIIIYKKDKHFIRIKCSNDTYDREPNRSSTSSTRERVSQMHIQSNNGLAPIHKFIDTCVKEYDDDKKNDSTRYMFTYLGLNTQKKPIYEQHIFKPYASFDGLIGDTSREIRKEFKFFTSEEGSKWFQQRNLPYQLTHCYYGEPGTGKSIIACAVAQEHNLHIVRIRLSDIKDNQEFVKVIRNTSYNGHKLEYKEILYLFDEFDTELEQIVEKTSDMGNLLKNPKKKTNKKKGEKQGSELSIMDSDDGLCGLFEELDDDLNEKAKTSILKHMKGLSTVSSKHSSLSIGVILEELNGINQMYGRKMIMITNKIDVLKTIHKGAFVRPGRIDRMCELKNMTHNEIRELLAIMYGNTNRHGEDFDNKITEIEEYKYSPAHMVNICKISKTLDDFFINLDKHDVN